MSEYAFTVEQFKKFVDLDSACASYLIPVATPHILVNCDAEGINSFLCDDVVEDGYMFQDWNYCFEVVEGVVHIRVNVKDMDEWIETHMS